MSAALIAKLESASEGSRELDLWIEGASYGSIGRLVGTTRDVPAYTTSIDAALALAERVIGGHIAMMLLADVLEANDGDLLSVSDIPRLLCAALLRASAAEGAGHE